jgi:homoserine O-succinyltransferase
MDKPNVERFALGRGGDRGLLSIGLVNAMPDAGLRATELAFARLLKDAAGGLDVRLTLFTLPQILRSPDTKARMEGFYADIGAPAVSGLDGLIVAAEEEMEDAAWDGFRQLVDWAQAGGVSTCFSGGATGLAARHLSGIAAENLPRQRLGIFTVSRNGEHPLVSGLPASWPVPHAARKALPATALAAQGYRILTRLADGGVDSFMRKGQASNGGAAGGEKAGLLLFFTGHPEYEPRALARRFLAGLADFAAGGAMPPVPEQYFDRLTENRLADLAGRRLRDFSAYQKLVQGAVPFAGWRPAAVKQCAAWLTAIALEKQAKSATVAHARRRRRA